MQSNPQLRNDLPLAVTVPIITTLTNNQPCLALTQQSG